MKQEQLDELNDYLLQPGVPKLPNQPVFHGVPIPTDAKEFNLIAFLNFKGHWPVKNFEEELRALGYIQDDDPDIPNLEILCEDSKVTNMRMTGKFILEHENVQVIYAHDQNAPNLCNIDFDDFRSDQEC